MSVIGIDLGSENSYVATVRAGGIEVLANDMGHRATPSYIGFGERNRVFGTTAKGQQVTNINNTIFGCKRLIGRRTYDSFAETELTYLPYHVYKLPNEFFGVKVIYRKKEVSFSVQQIVAMLLGKLKNIAEVTLDSEVKQCVLSVPSYFPDSARRAILDAGRIAGLNVARLLNDTASVALSYGFYKQNLSENKAIIVIFVNMGHTALQVSACSITKQKLTMLATVSNPDLGGRDFDNVLVRHFTTEFKEKYNLNVLSSTRATIRLLAECAKLKKQMSANPQILPLNIECFMEDKDVSGSLSRDKFEKMSQDLLLRTEHTLLELLTAANLKRTDINAIELVGGSSRIPAIKTIVQNVYGIEPSTTLNMDEAVARGCALHCAMLSPTMKVREYFLSDVQQYPIKLVWSISQKELGEVEVFHCNHQVPYSKYLTFYKTEPFTLEAYYGTVKYKHVLNDYIGSFLIHNISRSALGESAKVRIKVRLNIHGVFSVVAADIISKDDDDSTSVPDQNAEDMMDITGKVSTVQISPKNQENEKSLSFFQKKQKKTTKPVELPVTAKVPQLANEDLTRLINEEIKMSETDKYEKERVDMKNELEEYVYEIRNALAGDLEMFIDKEECQRFKSRLDHIENWLYQEGETQDMTVFSKTLSDLKKVIDPVYMRKQEHECWPRVVDDFKNTISRAQEILQMHAAKCSEFAYLCSNDIERLNGLTEDKNKWLKEQLSVLSQILPHQDPPILTHEILSEKEYLENELKAILNKPKN